MTGEARDGARRRSARGMFGGLAVVLAVACCSSGDGGSVTPGSGQGPDPVVLDFPIAYTLHLLEEKRELREALSDQDYDAVVVLGGPAGVPARETLQQIRSINVSVPLIFLTETLDVDRGSASLDAGADCYLWDFTRNRFQDLMIPVIRNLVQHRTDAKNSLSETTSPCGPSTTPHRLLPA